MTIQNLRPGDKFLHHQYGQTEIILIQKGCKLCKSKICNSFLVGDDYEPEFVNFCVPSKEQVETYLSTCSIEELKEINFFVTKILEENGV